VNRNRSSRVPRLHPARLLDEGGAGAPVHEPDEPELASLIAIDVVDVLVAVVAVLVAYLGLSAFRFVLRPRVFRWPNRGRSTCRRLRSCCSCCTSPRMEHHGRTIGKQVMAAGGAVQRCPDQGWTGLHAAILCSFFPFGLLWFRGRSQAPSGARHAGRDIPSPDGNLVAPRSSP
jgi:hypothetical protein